MDILKNLTDSMCFDSRDWSLNWNDAVLYSLIVGWEDDPDDPTVTEDSCYKELQEQHGWSNEFVYQLKQLHKQIKKLVEEN